MGVLMIVGALACSLIIEPVMATLLWMMGDHAFMPFYGEGAQVIWIMDALILIVGIVKFGKWAFGKLIDWLDSFHFKKFKFRGTKKVQTVSTWRIVKAYYKSHKEKFCFKIDIVDPNDDE